MRSIYPAVATLLFLGILGHPVFERAHGQPASAVESDTGQLRASKNLPSDFIDSRPIEAYFAGRPVPDTVRGMLEELKRSDACGEGAQLKPSEVCALVFYKLDDDFTPDRLRPPMIMRAIYRITEPKDLANTVLLMPDQLGSLERYADENLFEPLRDIRANICLRDKRKPEQCAATGSRGVLYHRLGILGKRENDREGILSAKSADKHFFLDPKSLDRDRIKTEQFRAACLQLRVSAPTMLLC